MSRKDKATGLFLEGYNCAQSVFAAFCDETGIDRKTALKLSSSFGAGMGKMREVCGAVSAMFMVIGLLEGYDEPDNLNKKEKHYERIQALAEKFKEKNGGTIICRELLKNIETNTDPKPDARTAEYYKIRPCARFVEDAAEIIDEFLEERKKPYENSVF